MARKCDHVGCTTRPNYGVAGSRTVEFCAGHKKDGMVNVRSKRCGHHGCTTGPSYGVAGSRTVEFCSQHKKDGMVDLKHKKCDHHGCTKVPSFGVEGTNKVEFCSEHKKDGMVYAGTKLCAHIGCTNHAEKSMVYIKGSHRRPSDGQRGRDLPLDDEDSASRTAAGEKRRRRSPSSADTDTSSGSSPGCNKRSRRSPPAVRVAPVSVAAAGDEGLVRPEDDLFSQPEDAGTKMGTGLLFEGAPPPGAFGVGGIEAAGGDETLRRRAARPGDDRRTTAAENQEGLETRLGVPASVCRRWWWHASARWYRLCANSSNMERLNDSSRSGSAGCMVISLCLSLMLNIDFAPLWFSGCDAICCSRNMADICPVCMQSMLQTLTLEVWALFWCFVAAFAGFLEC